MALAFDATTNSGKKTTQNYTFSHTVAAGLNMILVACTESFSGSRTVDKMTYAGQPMTKVTSYGVSGTNVEIWYLMFPASGANDVEVTLKIGAASTVTGVISLSGADPEAPIDAFDGGTPTGDADVSGTITTVADNCWIIDIISKGSNVGSGQTINAYVAQSERWTFELDNGVVFNPTGSSTRGPITPAGSTTMGWLFSDNTPTNCAHAMVSIKPAPDQPTIQGASTIQGISTIQF